MRARRFAPALILCFTLVFAACSDDDDPTGLGPGADVVPDFSLKDVNATSATFEQAVSPRDHLMKVSAWYFGHAT